VVAHFHIVMGVSSVFGMFAAVYHWFPKMFGRFMNRMLGSIHFWVSFIGAYMIFWPMHYMGLAGVPRRFYSFNVFQSFMVFDDLNKFITVAAILVFAAQLLFIVNFFGSIFWGRKVYSPNPWNANTLEWTTKIVPGHGNWEGAIPTVHRWPYDYSLNGRENIPQTEPHGDTHTRSTPSITPP
jgi:cytochrome c oxidase subunit 1